MKNLNQVLGSCVMAPIVFYVVMFFFAESIPLPYGSIPDRMKIERMVAAEVIECMVADGSEEMTSAFLLGASQSDIAKVMVNAGTREKLLEVLDETCLGTVR
ncbi:MAG: hypothetical protein F4W95_10005 [Chloroflexi bacterium]|nr:hypothetical protein [Chloroflexota bacterium]MYD48804.1 hypothetical protein [Chloroflexota bacterium]